MNKGDTVSLRRWDKYEPPRRRLGECVVISTEQVRNCESGIMVTVRNKKGWETTLDSNWLELSTPGKAEGGGRSLDSLLTHNPRASVHDEVVPRR